MKTPDYWIKREQAWQAQQIKDDTKRMKQIMNKLFEAQEAIQKEINANWHNFANGQGISISEAMKRADKMDVKSFGKKAKKYVETKDFSHRANQVLKLYNLTMRVNRLELLKANIGLELIAVFDELDKYFSNTLTGAALEEFERQAGILGLSVSKTGYKSLIEAVVNSGFQADNFASFSDKLWQYQFELKADLEKLLIRSVTQGKNPKELTQPLKRLMTEKGKQNATYYARRLLVTETTRVQTSIQEDSYKRAEIEEYKYIAEPDACPTCGALNGRTFKVNDMSSGINAPNMHPFCRCSTAPYIDDKAFWDSLLKRGVINQDEYEQAFDDREKADKTINNLIEQKEIMKDYTKFSKAFGKTALPNIEEFAKMRYNRGSEWEQLNKNYNDYNKWSKAKFPSEKSFNGHFKSHGAEFPGMNQSQYLKYAQKILSQPINERYLGYDVEFRRVRYDSKENIFVLGNGNNKITTMFKPDEGIKYYEQNEKRDKNY